MRWWDRVTRFPLLPLLLCGSAWCATASVARASDTTTNSLGMALRLVPAGHYFRGDLVRVASVFGKDHPGRNLADQEPPHPVRITRPFYLATTEVTVGQFRAFVQAAGYRSTAESGETSAVGFQPVQRNNNPHLKQPFQRGTEFTWKNPGFEQTDQHPVVCVYWKDAVAIFRGLSDKEGVLYRLPTEAEWEYACRAGSETAFAWENEYRQRIHQQANIGNVELEKAHSDLVVRQWFVDVERDPGDRHVFTAPVGSYPANAWGLSDMHGNVWEWCHDTYRDTFYEKFRSPRYPAPHQTAVDPVSEEPLNQFGDWRVIRGGSWYTAPILCRADNRAQFDAPDAACYLGFRVAREAPAELVAAAQAEWQQEQAAISKVKEVIGDFHVPPGTMLERTARFNERQATPEVTENLHRISGLTGVAANGINATFLQHVSRIRGLKSLEVYHLQELADADLSPLATLSQLEVLSLAGNSRLTDACVPHLAGLTTLKRLHLSGRAITDEGLVQLRLLKNLRELNLRDTNSKGAILSSLGEVPLERLELADLSDEHAARLTGLRDVEHLSCNGASLTDRGFAHFAALTRLKSLNLRGCRGLTPAAFDALRPLTRLTALDLADTQAGDAAVQQLAHHYDLTQLTLGSEHLTDQGMKHLCEIISLQNLSISAQSKVTDAGLQDFWRLQRLERLTLDCDQLTGSGFAELAEARSLQRLVIRSSRLTDAALDHVSTLPNLRELVLGKPGQLTDRGLLLLVDAEKLVHLEVTVAGSQITDEGIEQLKQAKPELRIQVRR